MNDVCECLRYMNSNPVYCRLWIDCCWIAGQIEWVWVSFVTLRNFSLLFLYHARSLHFSYPSIVFRVTHQNNIFINQFKVY